MAPENTLAAFNQSILDGANGIEFDVRLAGDDINEGDVVVWAGMEVGAGDAAVLASLGLSPLRLVRRP